MAPAGPGGVVFRMLDLLSEAWIAPGTLGSMRAQWFYGDRPGSSRAGR